ncbi:MAG: hypothetical protein H0X64_03455 [Gemmatimonadaceae bacterium]|nr:hypothetical protein [Gemmatimonadaceae bacterium]
MATGPRGRFTSFIDKRGWIESTEIFIGNTPEPPMGWGVAYTHEMLHILGAGHTSRIPTPQGAAMRTSEPSQYDVAYLELAREIMPLERLHNTKLSLMPATIGQRRLEFGLPALPMLHAR